MDMPSGALFTIRLSIVVQSGVVDGYALLLGLDVVWAGPLMV